MKRYRCKKCFVVDCYDPDGFLIQNDGKVVDVGEIYTLDETSGTIIGGEIHLDGEDGSWLETSHERLKECFEEI